MNIFQQFYNRMFGSTSTIVKDTTTTIANRSGNDGRKALETSMPVAGGRQTQPKYGNLMNVVLDELSFVNADFPFELLPVLEHLAAFNSDFSYGVDNLIQLGNTSYLIEFDKDVSEEAAAKMQDEISSCEALWYKGGINSLRNDLFAQVAVKGALCAEIVTTLSLDGVEKVVLVDNKTIRFKYDSIGEDYHPYQDIALAASSNKSANTTQVKLNTTTFKYYAHRRFNEKPYGMPPFLSSLESIQIEQEMICGLKNVVSKLGVFGFLHVLVKAPKATQGEKPSEYQARLKTYLTDHINPELEKGLNKGFVSGFKDTHEFKLENTIANMAGIKDLVELITINKHSGMKQDSIMFSRNFTTTETLGRVVLAKMTNQVRNYQKLIDTFIKDLVFLHLFLKGYPIKHVKVTSEAPMVQDRKNVADARNMEIMNAKELYYEGIISQAQRAELLGFDEPFAKEPIERPENKVPEVKKEEDKGNKKSDLPKSTAVNSLSWMDAAVGLGSNYDTFRYHSNCGHVHTKESWGITEDINQFFSQYFGKINEGYKKAVDKAMNRIGTALLALDARASVELVIETVLYSLYVNWQTDFTSKQGETIGKFINLIYNRFRKDTRIFKAFDPNNIPDAVFDQLDLRTLQYFKKSDNLYLGKFITDDDTRKKVITFIKDKFVVEGLPIGDNKQVINEFKSTFSKLMLNEDWKIRRIIETTINQMRNYGAVNYMQQAEVSEFERLEIIDQKTCGWCKELNGKRFKVDKAVGSIDQLMRSEPQLVGSISPFMTSLYKKPEDLKGVTVEELQDKGLGFGSTHPHCRGQNIAVL